METRVATVSDLDGIESVLREAATVWDQDRPFLEANPDAILVPAGLVDLGQVRVAIDRGAVVGFSSYTVIDAMTWEVEDLFVRPDRMGGGIGRQLIRDMVESAAATGRAGLEVTANPQAVGFYEKVGFVTVGMVPTRFRPGVRMYRRIAS